MKSRVLEAVGVAAVVGGVLVAQTPASPAFDVASIKVRTVPPVPGGGPQSSPDRYTRINVSLRDLILDAYQLQSYQIVGGPDWLTGAVRFDVMAKASFVPSPEQMSLMVQRLLAERFAVSAHHETREMPTYLLRTVRNDGKLGAQLTRTTVDCEAIKADRATRGTSPPPTASGGQPLCGTRVSVRHLSPGRSTLRYQASGVSSGELAAWLSRSVPRTVVDRTGLTGMFDVDLTFNQDDLNASVAPGVAEAPAASVFTALQDQLGLKLESATGPVDVLVIDHVEHPTED
jgi:uncharacterized protein (TIGR03435 family)